MEGERVSNDDSGMGCGAASYVLEENSVRDVAHE
jgi:hypothetical protein